MAQDDTNRNMYEGSLPATHELLNAIMQSSPVSITVFDLQGRFLLASESALTVLGKSKDEVVGKTFADLFPPETAASFTQRLEQLRQTRSGLEVEESIVIGNHPLVFASRLFPIFDANHQHYAYIAIATDVTEHKRREERLHQIIDAAPFGAHNYELLPDGRLVFTGANRSADTILRVENQQFVGQTIEEAFPALTDTEVPSMYRRVASDGITYDAEQITYDEKGIRGIFEVRAVQTGTNRMTAFFLDVTELANNRDLMLQGWSSAMDLRDKETEGHTQRVTLMTVQLARAMGLGESEILHIRRGALLHDIGKIGVPDSILFKPDKLTDEEWIIMRKHPEKAYEMLVPITFLRGAALDIPYCHHEKWDGTGYPRGLKGMEIPLAARIFAVADVWDALRFDRPYRKAWTAEQVREYIQTQAGVHFDPQVVAAFLRLEGNQ